jgi:subtilisin family serine protease
VEAADDSGEPTIEEPPVEVPPIEELPPSPPVEGEPLPSGEPPVAPVEPTPSSQVPGEPSVPPVVEPMVDPRDAQISQLTSTIEQLKNMVENIAKQSTTPTSATIEAAPTEEPVIKFIEKEDDLDEVLKSTDSFNAFMTKVVNRSKDDAFAVIPQLVGPIVNKIVTQKLAVNEFYANNTDLATCKATVGIVANEIAAANPAYSMEDIIKVLGPEVRNRLALGTIQPIAPQAPVQPVAPVETPAFVPGGSSRPNAGGVVVTKMEQGISELLDGIDL